MKPLIKTQCLELSFLGFRDLEWIDSITSSLPLHFYNKSGIPIIYTGHAYITPEGFADRVIMGTESTKPENWLGIPPTYELFFNIYEWIEEEQFLELLQSWAKDAEVTCRMSVEMDTWNESYDGSLEVCNHECDNGWEYFIKFENGEITYKSDISW